MLYRKRVTTIFQLKRAVLGALPLGLTLKKIEVMRNKMKMKNRKRAIKTEKCR